VDGFPKKCAQSRGIEPAFAIFSARSQPIVLASL